MLLFDAFQRLLLVIENHLDPGFLLSYSLDFLSHSPAIKLVTEVKLAQLTKTGHMVTLFNVSVQHGQEIEFHFGESTVHVSTNIFSHVLNCNGRSLDFIDRNVSQSVDFLLKEEIEHSNEDQIYCNKHEIHVDTHVEVVVKLDHQR